MIASGKWRGAGLFAFGIAAGFAAVAGIFAAAQGQQSEAARLQALKASFARPGYVPHPENNPPTPAKIALGKRIFSDPILSVTGKVSCATCHDEKLSFTDGERLGKGVTGKRLVRHSPSLWNSAFSPLLFWDGRANSLEDQARFPVSHPDEMGASLEAGAQSLQKIASYEAAFAEAFPGSVGVSAELVARALAAYERTLISPPTRFDRWVAGDGDALSDAEIRGFAIFTGKGRCSACHNGFAFTDHGFYDIGLPTKDEGRGKIIALGNTNFAFKTPTLREIAWTAPYMHDGSLATLDDVIRHYERGGIKRPTLADDMPKGLKLTDGERRDLLAFLDTLSSETPPEPSRESWVLSSAGRPKPEPVQSVNVVHQAGKRFTPRHVEIAAADGLTVLNDDTRTHNVRIFDPRFDFNSGAQEPRQSLSLRFPGPGTYEAFCGIHPSMRLTIEVK